MSTSLEWDGRRYRSEMRGTVRVEGLLRAAARATLGAAGQACGGEVVIDLVGIKAVRAFDAHVVIASVMVTSAGRRQRLLGAQPVEGEDLVEAAAKAVLGALNRVLGRFIGEPPEDDGVGKATPAG